VPLEFEVRSTVYLDHNASAPLLPEARAALLEVFDLVGNPSAVHGHGRALRNRLETGREQVAKLAGAEAKQVVFTGSATEAITQAIVGGAKAFGVDGIIVSGGEHRAVLAAAEATGLPVTLIGLDADGVIALDELRGALLEAEGKTLLVALHWVNNETGVVQPVGEIGAIVGPSPHILFIDACQAFGKIPLDFAASAPDMMAVSGHKIGAPVGVGALLVKSHADIVRLIPGGGQEQGRRGGTEAAALVAAFGAASEGWGRLYAAEHIEALVVSLETQLLERAPSAVVFGAKAQRAGNVVDFAVPGVTSAVAMMALDLKGISVSSGSACSSGKVGTSHVLKAMGVPDALAACALRISLGWNSTADDVAAFLDGFSSVLDRHDRRTGRAA
jgi:cysteine desulfurase